MSLSITGKKYMESRWWQSTTAATTVTINNHDENDIVFVEIELNNHYTINVAILIY